MTVELDELLVEVARTNWAPVPSERLAQGIEERIIAFLPSRARSALGGDEAAQLARVIAWERCRKLSRRGSGQISWGYLANVVRWRLADAVRADSLRRQRHPLSHQPPERSDETTHHELGPLLECLSAELTRTGLPDRIARQLMIVASEGPRFERSAIRGRLLAEGVPRSQSEGLAWLLRGGAANPSAIARLASGQSPSLVFQDAVVRRWLAAAAGLDTSFIGGRTGTAEASRSIAPADAAGPGLARTA